MAEKITVAELLVKIGVDSKKAEAAAKRLKDSLEEVGDAGETADEGVTKAEKSLQRFAAVGRGAEKVASSLSKIMLGVVGVVGGLGKSVLGTGIEFERLGKQLETATGSAEAAEQALSFIREFAATTPFQVQEITDAFVKLKNRGLDPSTETLTALGNTSSALGKTLDQTVEAALDAVVGEFERLRDFGIKASKQGDQVSFTFRGVTTTVKNTEKDILGVLTRIGNVDFADAMTDQMTTAGGLISNLKDTWATFLDQVANLGPLEEFKGLVSDLKNALGVRGDGLAKILADTLVKAIRSVRRILRGDFAGTIERAIKLISTLAENFDKLIGLFTGAKIVSAFASAAQGLSSLGIAATGALGPIGAIAGALAALIPIALDVGDKLGDVFGRVPGAGRVKTRGVRKSVDLQRAGLGDEGAAVSAELRQVEAQLRATQGAPSAVTGGKGILGGPGAPGMSRASLEAKRASLQQRLAQLQGEAARIVQEREREAASIIDAQGAALSQLLAETEARAAARPSRPKRKGGRGKARKRTPTSPVTVSEFFGAAARGDLGPIAARTPSTKDIEPTVAVDITNFNFQIDQEINSTADAKEVADNAVAAIKREFRTRLDRAGRALAGGQVA